jgi:hypothetical protein
MTTADELKAQIMARRKGGPIPDLSYLAENGRKKCKICKETKSTEAFCVRRASFDKFETRCRECNKARIWAIRDKTPGYNAAHSRKFKEKHPQKRAAHLAVARALRAGTLTKQPCLVCGNAKSESHHEDYTKPLDVIWFCRQHHAAHHEIKRKQNENK